MKTAISIPDQEFALNDDAAKRHTMNRSQFYAEAARRYRHYLESSLSSASDISAKTRSINEVIARVGPSPADVDANADAINNAIDNTAAAVFEAVEW
jgi:parvulin-like peptidyl-prolyl isomerase